MPFSHAGASPPVIYDVTRLVTRALNLAPNGIDRVDFALARHFLSRPIGDNAALICTILGPRIVPAALALSAVEDIETCWREFDDPTGDPVYEALVRALESAGSTKSVALRVRRFHTNRITASWRAFRRWAFRLGGPPSEAPLRAIYFNASGFLLDKAWFLRWLERRADVRPVFFVHDLLPIDLPEFFWAREGIQHHARIRNICRYGAGAVVGSNVVARRLGSFALAQGRADLPMRIARLPVSEVFSEKAECDPRLAGHSYFVVCGTMEPRKNYVLLLQLWRELATRHGALTPKLIIVGKRGWNNRNELDLLDRCAALRGCVVEVAGLSTPALRRLLAGALALLAPSFAEGFGLPLAEAIGARVPVIASNIDVFREIGGDVPDFVDPLDGPAWLEAIEDYAVPGSSRRARALARVSNAPAHDNIDFFASVDEFIDRLSNQSELTNVSTP